MALTLGRSSSLKILKDGDKIGSRDQGLVIALKILAGLPPQLLEQLGYAAESEEYTPGYIQGRVQDQLTQAAGPEGHLDARVS